MARCAIADTGPLVAFFDRSERHHAWASERVRELSVPLLVCEPVLAETMYLLGELQKAQDALYGLLQNGALRIALRIEDHLPALRALHHKYRDTPMSLAGACIVRMAELYGVARGPHLGLGLLRLPQARQAATGAHSSLRIEGG